MNPTSPYAAFTAPGAPIEPGLPIPRRADDQHVALHHAISLRIEAAENAAQEAAGDAEEALHRALAATNMVQRNFHVTTVLVMLVRVSLKVELVALAVGTLPTQGVTMKRMVALLGEVRGYYAQAQESLTPAYQRREAGARVTETREAAFATDCYTALNAERAHWSRLQRMAAERGISKALFARYVARRRAYLYVEA